MKLMVLLIELHITQFGAVLGWGNRKMEHKLGAGMDETPSPSKQGSQILGFRIFLFHHHIHWDMKRKRFAFQMQFNRPRLRPWDLRLLVLFSFIIPRLVSKITEKSPTIVAW